MIAIQLAEVAYLFPIKINLVGIFDVLRYQQSEGSFTRRYPNADAVPGVSA